MNHTKWTDEHLKTLNPCANGYEWYAKNCRDKGIDNTAQIIDLLIKDDRLEWANWTIARALSGENRIRYAIFAAEQVIDIFERKYPKDDRPRKAIEAAKAVLKNDNEKTKSAAADSADSAGLAAWSAWSAADSADSADSAGLAAWSAGFAARSAESARSAAWSTAESAGLAAWSATWSAESAAESAMKEKIIRYGVGLLKKD